MEGVIKWTYTGCEERHAADFEEESFVEFLKRTWAEVSLDNLTYNYNQLRSHVPASTRFLGVVKADAYGHGAVAVSRHLEELGAEFLAVSNLEEAEQLRNHGIHLPILLLGYTPAIFAEYEADNGIRQEVNAIDYARQLNARLEGTGKRLKVHLKLDTGMSRLGFFAYDRPETIDELVEISKLPNLEIEGVFQHFCVADSHKPECQAFTQVQYGRFTAMLDEMAAHGIKPEIRHCCNSAATILHPEFAMDMVRPGIATYGFAPDACMEGDMDLRPLLSWRSTISQIKDFDEGITVSYGRLWTTPSKRRIAVVPIGYADGLSRRLTNHVDFLLRGKRVHQVGRICMDMCMIDVTDIPDAQVGDTITILGRDGEELLRCEDMAAQLETITYEITCDINKRVPRIYRKDGKEVGKLQYIV